MDVQGGVVVQWSALSTQMTLRSPPLFCVCSEPQYSPWAQTGKDTAIHTRIIWSCDWTPDSRYFVTSSRDKKVRGVCVCLRVHASQPLGTFPEFTLVCVQVIVWGPCSAEGEEPPEIKPCSSILDVGDSATAAAFCPVLLSDNRYTHTQVNGACR